MPRLVVVALILACLAPLAQADQPLFSFDGILPIIFQMHQPFPGHGYGDEARSLTDQEIMDSLDIRKGDKCVLIRGGAVVGQCTIGDIMVKNFEDAKNGHAMYMIPAGLPEGVAVPEGPRGPDALLDVGYDLFIITESVVEVLAPDPAFQDVSWGEQDFVVRIGRLRFSILREKWHDGNGYRGWHVEKFKETGAVKVHADYTWQPK